MMFSTRTIAVFGTLGLAYALAGCSGGTTGTAPAKPAAGAPQSSQTGVEVTADNEHKPGPALSAEDQALADLQKICPVSGEELGSMGAPVKLTVKGEPVFICCKACEKTINADPDKYLAKVAELKKSKPE